MLITCALIASCSIAGKPSSCLIGDWTPEKQTANDDKVILQLKADGTFEEVEESAGRKSKFVGTWRKQSDSEAILTRSDSKKKAAATLIDKQTLELLSASRQTPLFYTRVP
jgi:hypothetical protein